MTELTNASVLHARTLLCSRERIGTDGQYTNDKFQSEGANVYRDLIKSIGRGGQTLAGICSTKMEKFFAGQIKRVPKPRAPPSLKGMEAAGYLSRYGTYEFITGPDVETLQRVSKKLQGTELGLPGGETEVQQVTAKIFSRFQIPKQSKNSDVQNSSTDEEELLERTDILVFERVLPFKKWRIIDRVDL